MVKTWLYGWAQGVVVNGAKSGWQPVASGALQGTVLGLVLFNNCLISLLDVGIECSQFANDTELSVIVGC